MTALFIHEWALPWLDTQETGDSGPPGKEPKESRAREGKGLLFCCAAFVMLEVVCLFTMFIALKDI